MNVDVDELPGWLEAIGRGVPLTHGIEAARRIVAGEPLGEVAGLVGTEVLIGAIYVAVAYGLFRWFERQSRLRAALDTF